MTVAEASESARRSELPTRAAGLFTGRGLASDRVVLAWLKKTGAQPDKVNVNGGRHRPGPSPRRNRHCSQPC